MALRSAELPRCTLVINRIPHPDAFAEQLARRLLLLLQLSVVLPWLLLCILAAHRLYRRLRRRRG